MLTHLAKPSYAPLSLVIGSVSVTFYMKGASAQNMTKKSEENKPKLQCSFCNYDADYFESGFLWCKYHYWVDFMIPSKESLRYLDVIA